MSATCRVRLDKLTEQGITWRVWAEWRYCPLRASLLWHGEVRTSDGTLLAEVRDYRPGKTVNGESGAERHLWRAYERRIRM